MTAKYAKRRKIKTIRAIVLASAMSIAMSACSTRVDHEVPTRPGAADALNINAATVEELEKLPGIGRKTAETIVEYRTTNGPFRRVEHLMLIQGVSETRFAELRPYVKTE